MSKRILVCDDSMLMRKIVADALVEDGWEVVGEAGNGAQAAEMYQELKPDAVTMDIVMPEYDGIHGLEVIMKFDPNAVVVMVSAISKTELISDAIRKGAQDFIVKPFLPELLQETMTRIINAHSVNAS
ncbi:MAG: two-component system response regulator [Blastopirellula sp.]|nr:MAG: two-component system response regulator [Blastopirellula sp.]